MSFFHTLEMSLFTDNARWVPINIGKVMHIIPMDTILNCPRRVRIATMIVHYCALKDDNPDKASFIFKNRDGQLFSHILHYADTHHLVYPSDLEVGKTLVRDLCRYGLIRVKDGYCHQCLMEYFKLNGMDDFRNEKSGEKDLPFAPIFPETMIIQTENAGGDIFALRAWGTPKTLAEMFPKGKLENDSTYFQLSMCVTVIHTDPCKFMKEIAETVCCVIKKMGFRPTTYSTWSDESRVVHFGQWLFYRQVPAITSFPSVTVAPPPTVPVQDTTPVASSQIPVRVIQPKAKKKPKCCPCFYKEDSIEVLTDDYPDLPPRRATAEVKYIAPRRAAAEVKHITPRNSATEETPYVPITSAVEEMETSSKAREVTQPPPRAEVAQIPRKTGTTVLVIKN